MMKQLTAAAVLGMLLAAAAGASAQEGPTTTTAPAELLQVVIFNSRTCARGCRDVDNYLPSLAERWAGKIRIETHYVDDQGDPKESERALMLLLAYDKHYNADAETTPIAYVGGRYLKGSKDILSQLESVVEAEFRAEASTYAPTESDLEELFTSQGPSQLLERLGIWGVVVAGLLDGINPCAFTTIIFLLSMMTYLGKSRRDIAAVGVGYTVAVFATYFLIGLGLLSAVKIFSVQHGIATAISYGVGVLALGLAVWSMVDFIRYMRSGKTSSATLGLPDGLRKRIHKVIREGLKVRRLLLGAIVIGFLVAVLESLCTGQVYLPTITVIARTPGMRAYGVAYLLLYNGAFILPLVILLGSAYWGVSSERLGQLLRHHLGLLKLLMALLFAFLGVLVLATA
ncbi:hypothetical protein LCGC14_0016450 [marine sediment metagenome]|uniref:Cytochrome C biogenesis protein transmembrane domain-containing protein n=1 Tax=marine sediment metagenome TaxID=412755 RepID=A0A0F9Z228_9ZZZZ|nr:hypothetical protein [Phycisphaerae bacterium]HDZ42854.1 hypothetical protein [Phycisphaerae bacterium]